MAPTLMPSDPMSLLLFWLVFVSCLAWLASQALQAKPAAPPGAASAWSEPSVLFWRIMHQVTSVSLQMYEVDLWMWRAGVPVQGYQGTHPLSRHWTVPIRTPTGNYITPVLTPEGHSKCHRVPRRTGCQNLATCRIQHTAASYGG